MLPKAECHPHTAVLSYLVLINVRQKEEKHWNWATSLLLRGLLHFSLWQRSCMMKKTVLTVRRKILFSLDLKSLLAFRATVPTSFWLQPNWYSSDQCILIRAWNCSMWVTLQFWEALKWSHFPFLGGLLLFSLCR